jgi:diguanylate cyclase (GGDEF)-like protein
MAYGVRDVHGASRSLAYLMLAAGPFVFVTCLVTSPSFTVLLSVSLTCVFIVAGGVLCWARPHLLPPHSWLLAPTLCTLLITGLNLVTQDASTGAQLFYLWPVLYAANFLSRRTIYFCLASVYSGDAVTVFLAGSNVAASDWTAMVMAMTMIAVIVVSLRARADKLLRVLEGQALADPLTGLANRRSFDDALTRAGVWARRKGAPLALLTVDLDHFKAINDTWGHAVGDRALQAVATAMGSVVREEDLAARLGGDEFVMLLRADRAGAVRVAQALRTAVAEISTLPGGPPGLSIGVAVLPDDADTVEALVTASDAALYEAKTSGRGRVSVAADSGLPLA